MKRKNLRKLQILIYLFSFFIVCFLFFSFIEKRLLPPLTEISHIQCKTIANQIIDTSAINIMNQMGLSAESDFISYTETEGYATNTILINQICSSFSQEITEKIQTLPYERILIPIGSASGSDFLANKGPSVPFTLLPMGQANVDYESEIRSVGINQINYKIWLNISIDLKVVNPLYQEKITLERKIMLTDIVFSGKVPEHYFQMDSPNEYLLTE